MTACAIQDVSLIHSRLFKNTDSREEAEGKPQTQRLRLAHTVFDLSSYPGDLAISIYSSSHPSALGVLSRSRA